MTDQHHQLKFDLYIDAVGDGATRSRGIISLLMTATVVAGLGLFNSLRVQHNWFASRLDSLHRVYEWVIFPDDPQTTIRSLKFSQNSLPVGIIKWDTITKEKRTNKQDPIDVLHKNIFNWQEFRSILVANGIPWEDTAIEVSPHLSLKFPDYCISSDSTINITPATKEELDKIITIMSRFSLASRREMNDVISHYDRARIENAILVRMPVLGVSFDVNWLGFVSSLAFSIILFMLYFSLSRERKNLFLAFKEAENRGIDRIDFYQMLSMRQVLSIPKSINEYIYGPQKSDSELDILIRKWNKRVAMYPLYTPAVVWILILMHDISTFRIGLSINHVLTLTSFTFSILLGGVMFLFVYLCWLEWRRINDIWNEQANRIIAPKIDPQG